MVGGRVSPEIGSELLNGLSAGLCDPVGVEREGGVGTKGVVESWGVTGVCEQGVGALSKKGAEMQRWPGPNAFLTAC